MEQFWNYYGVIGIVIMVLTTVIMICEYADRDKVAMAINHPSISGDDVEFWIPAWFEYKHCWVKILSRSCMVVSIILMLIICAGPYYDDIRQSLKAPFAYTYVLFFTVVFIYLWMQVIRVFGFLLLMLAYVLFWCYCWMLGFDSKRI